MGILGNNRLIPRSPRLGSGDTKIISCKMGIFSCSSSRSRYLSSALQQSVGFLQDESRMHSCD